MSISSLLRILWHHPRVVGSVALLSLLGLLGIVVTSPPTYRASAAVVLLNPPAVPTATAARPEIPAQYQNPYVRFGDLSVVVDILVRITGSQEVVDSLKARGLDGTFTIAANRDFYRGPIVDVAAEAKSKSASINDTKLVVKEIQDQLVALQTQQGTDPAYFIRAELVVGADRATTVFSGTLRLLIAAGGLGGVLTIGSGLLADAIQRRRLSGSDNFSEEGDDPSDDENDDDKFDSDGLVTSGRRSRKAKARQRDEALLSDGRGVSATEPARSPAPRPVKPKPADIARSNATPSAVGRDPGIDPLRHGVVDAEEVRPAERVPGTCTGTLPERQTTPSDRRLDVDLPPGNANRSVPNPGQRKKRRRPPGPRATNDRDKPR